MCSLRRQLIVLGCVVGDDWAMTMPSEPMEQMDAALAEAWGAAARSKRLLEENNGTSAAFWAASAQAWALIASAAAARLP
jgi:hypothetical protein